MVTILDYGVGNLFSLRSSLASLGETVTVTGDPDKIYHADRLLLPGVGAFGDAARLLGESGAKDALLSYVKRGNPLLGICLGMQLLFDKSHEYGEHEGLHLIPGEVLPMEGALPEGLKIPHIGWNGLKFSTNRPKSPLFRQVEEGDCVYFVHSFYAAMCKTHTTAVAEYGIPITAAVENGNVFGVQFHPEKSGKVGLSILKAFCEEGL